MSKRKHGGEPLLSDLLNDPVLRQMMIADDVSVTELQDLVHKVRSARCRQHDVPRVRNSLRHVRCWGGGNLAASLQWAIDACQGCTGGCEPVRS